MRRFTPLYRAAALVALLYCSAAEVGHADKQCGPTFAPANFAVQTDNPYFPVAPRTDIYVVEDDDGLLVNEITVTDCTVLIDGVLCTVIYDVEYLVTEDGECLLLEETLDYHAWDGEGNFWYFGEDTMEYLYDEDTWQYYGCSREGTWLAGQDGAIPGIIMLASPEPGCTYYQEFAEGIAEDEGKVLQTGISIFIESCGDLDGVVKTKEWSNLSPGNVEHKFYAPGKGLVLIQELKEKTVTVELAEAIPVDFDCVDAIDDFLMNRFGAIGCPPEPDCADLPLHMP